MKIEIKEYQKEGLTSAYDKLLLNNPKGQALYHNEINRHKMPFGKKILNNAVYYKFCRKAGYGFSEIWEKSEAKIFLLMALPIGIYMYGKIKGKGER